MNNETKAPLADSIALYLAHKHSLGKQLMKVGPMLYLLDRYLLAQGIAELLQVTPAHVEGFILPAALFFTQLQRTHWSSARTVRLDGGPRATD